MQKYPRNMDTYQVRVRKQRLNYPYLYILIVKI